MFEIMGDFNDNRQSESFDSKQNGVFFVKGIAHNKVLKCVILLPFWIKGKHFTIYKYFGVLNKTSNSSPGPFVILGPKKPWD